jgi:hypothetical protein
MKRARRTEHGLSSLELTLMLPLLVLLILFLIGMGHTIMAKQHALVAARYAASYYSVHDRQPSAGQVSQAVSAGTETWRLSAHTASAAGDVQSSLGGISGMLASALGSFMGTAGSRGVISYTVSTTPERGILPRLFRLNDAEAKFSLASGTWVCRGSSSYLSAIIPVFSLPGMSLSGGLSCCRPYQEER